MTTVLAITPAGQSLILFLVVLFIAGLVIGGIARLLVPGPQPLGLLGTAAAGVGGALLGGLVGRLLFGPTYAPGWIMSILGAMLIVWLVGRRRTPHYY
ncbi:MAG: GlsB/YeaQ/YmgE family stress response membrane protein [Acidimicrobiales bacterium]